MVGLDDLAHNRLYLMNFNTGEFLPASNWGKRNYNEKCYCKELKKLGINR